MNNLFRNLDELGEILENLGCTVPACLQSQTDDFSLPEDFLKRPQEEIHSELPENVAEASDMPPVAHQLTPSRLSRSASVSSTLSSASTVRSTDSRHSLTPSRKSTKAVQRKIAELRILQPTQT